MRLYIRDLKKEEGNYVSFSDSFKLKVSKEESVIMVVNLRAAYLSDRVILEGNWQVDLDGECSRCLENFSYHLGENFQEEFIHQQGSMEQEGFEEVIEQGNGELLTFKGESLDLTEFFRQSFLMSQPLKILCRSDCKGLCPVCGVNKNKEQCRCVQEDMDPRWAALKKIKKEL